MAREGKRWRIRIRRLRVGRTRTRKHLGGQRMSKLRSHLTYANVIASLALFLALGGGAYAAVSTIPAADGTIPGCYATSDGAPLGARGTTGAPGPRGTAGAQGAAAPAGPAGLAGAAGVNGTDGAIGPAG